MVILFSFSMTHYELTIVFKVVEMGVGSLPVDGSSVATKKCSTITE